MTRWIARITILLFAAAAARADSVTLRPGARVADLSAVTLGAVAELSGPEVEPFADMQIPIAGADTQAWVEVKIEDVRRALDGAKVNWGRVSLRGTQCTVRLQSVAVQKDDRVVEAPQPRVPTTVSLEGPATVRTRVVSLMARLYDVAPEDLRVLFDDSEESFLDMPEAGRRIEVQPAATASSSRFAVIVWVYEGDLLVESRTLRIDLRVRRPVVTLRTELQRGDVIRAEHLSAETVWLEPTGPATISSIESAVGSVARRRLGAGTMLRVDLLESPILVRRNELVTVHCISGGIVVKAKARARAEAREGDLVELSMDGSKKTFQARIVGPGRAVVNLDGGTPIAER